MEVTRQQAQFVVAISWNFLVFLESEDASSMFFHKGLHLFAVFFLVLLYTSNTATEARPTKGNSLSNQSLHMNKEREANLGAVKARIGSRPPSCVNKCDSCTPCQAVQASNAEMSTYIGSRPPSCQNKCNRCSPCQAVQVPTPIQRQVPSTQEGQQVSVEYSNYKPEGWKCKCGNKLFNP